MSNHKGPPGVAVIGCNCATCVSELFRRGEVRANKFPKVEQAPLEEVKRIAMEQLYGGPLQPYQRDMIKALADAGEVRVSSSTHRYRAYSKLREHLLRGNTATLVIKDEYAFDEKKVVATLIETCGLWRPITTAPLDTLIWLKRFERVTFGAYQTRSEPALGYRPCWTSWDGGFSRRLPPLHWAPAPEQDWHRLRDHVKRFGYPCAHLSCARIHFSRNTHA